MLKRIIALMFVVLLLSGLAACTPAATTAPTTAAPTPAAAASPTIDRIKKAGKLVMMTNASFPPFEYLKSGKVDGIDVELSQLIAKELGVTLEVTDMNFDLLIPSLQGGKGDLAAAGMSITEARKKEVDFTIPYFQTTLMIIVPKGSEIKDAKALNGKKIAVQEATTSDLYASSEDYIEKPGEILRFKSAVDAGNSVRSKKADASVMDEMTAQNIVNASNGELILLTEPLTVEEYAMAIKKGQPDLLEAINKVLEKAVADKVVDQLTTKHMEATKVS